MADENVYMGSVFVNDLLRNVFRINLTSNDYINIGGIECSRNVFSNCILQNAKYLGENYVIAIKVLIMREVKDNNKKIRLFNYFKKHLPGDVLEFIKNNPDEIEKIVDLAISKFRNNNSDKNKKEIEPIIKEISELYLKIVAYLKEDRTIGFTLIHNTIDKITEYIVRQEELVFINNNKNRENKKIKINAISYKNGMPKSISNIIESLYSLLKVKDSSDSYKDLMELIFISTKKVIKWFVEDYLGNKTQFSVMDYKAEELYYNSEEKNIRVCSVDDLKEMGWTAKDIIVKYDKCF